MSHTKKSPSLSPPPLPPFLGWMGAGSRHDFLAGAWGPSRGRGDAAACRAARWRAGGPPRLVWANGNINHPMGMGTSGGERANGCRQRHRQSDVDRPTRKHDREGRSESVKVQWSVLQWGIPRVFSVSQSHLSRARGTEWIFPDSKHKHIKHKALSSRRHLFQRTRRRQSHATEKGEPTPRLMGGKRERASERASSVRSSCVFCPNTS